jgi:pyruvate ferredoxin oxidoreductase alpha subunit
MGSFATKAKDAVDHLRQSNVKVGLLRPRLLRPFPEQHIQKGLAGKKAVAVIDQNLSMGKGGILFTEIASVLYGRDDAPGIVASFVAGLGGRDITIEEFYEIAAILQDAVQKNKTPPPRLLYTEAELRAMRKLQAIAQVEHRQLKPDK